MAYTTINKQGDYFSTKLFIGNTSARSISGIGFQPDWCWFKNRSQSNGHSIFDAVRGATKNIISNSNAVESTSSNGLTAFASDGFSIGSDGDVNGLGDDMVAWNWRAGGGQGSSNTDGTINTTYTSVNTTAGFSICKWSGSGSAGTIGHGLGAVPKMIIAKRITGGVRNWPVYHHGLGNDKKLYLNDTQAESSSTNWNSTTPTSSVFSVGSADDINGSGSTYIAYCFAEKSGYSKFGKYTGNANTDGIFLYTGFKPSWVMIKNRSESNDWYLFDNSRDTLSPNNPVGRKSLYANTSGAEVTRTTKDMDFLSNGIKIRTADGSQNNNGANYIYMCFGQSIVGTNNIPATAR
tara:strand:+ start:1579 stop:2628 length:1050 start_codon:yes stop_codon:yes gene_type:complete